MSKSGSRWEFGPTDRIRIGCVDYVPLGVVPGGHTFERVDRPGFTVMFSDEDIDRFYDQPGFRFDKHYYSPAKQALRRLADASDLGELPPRELAVIKKRLTYCNGWIVESRGGDRSASAMEDFIARTYARLEAERRDEAKAVTEAEPTAKKRKPRCDTKKPRNTDEPPTTRTLFRWLRRYEEYDYDPMALCPGYCRAGDTKSRIAAKVRRAMYDRVEQYASEKRPTFRHLYGLLTVDIETLNVAEGLTGGETYSCPSYKTFRKEVDKLDSFHIYAGRQGVKRANAKYALQSSGLDVRRPMQRVEMDHWNISLQIILEDNGVWHLLSDVQKREMTVRLHICVAIDCASRCILGMSIATTPTVENSRRTLAMAVSRTKGSFADLSDVETHWDMCGTPHEVATDTGAEFHGDLQVAVALIGAGFYMPPAGIARQRGRIERLFRTLQDKLLPYFTGRTFQNTVALGEYPAQVRASLDVPTLAALMVRWVVDAYHNSEHSELFGETPRRAWLRLSALYPVVPPPDRHRMRAAFGREVIRTLGPQGVTFLGLNFQSEALHSILLQQGSVDASVRVDLDDISCVSVRVKQGAWIECPCQREGMEGIGATAWIAAVRHLTAANRENAALDQPIVMRAARDIEAAASRAEHRRHIARTTLSDDEIVRAERETRIGFTAPGDYTGSQSRQVAPVPVDPSTPVSEPKSGDVAPAAKPRFTLKDE